MIISLVGFMGTGKSTIGAELAEKLNYKFVETDIIIEENANMTISEIFAKYGEKHFRILEENILKEILEKGNENLVVSTGGGIVLSDKNRERLKNKSFPILLIATPEEIYRRVDIDSRPLLANADDPCKKIYELLELRKDFYYDFKNRVFTDNKSKMQVVEEIIKITGVENSGEKNKC